MKLMQKLVILSVLLSGILELTLRQTTVDIKFIRTVWSVMDHNSVI